MLNRRWFQFRLRTLFVLVTFVAAGLAWLAERQKIAGRREALKHIAYDFTKVQIEDGFAEAQPQWRIWLLGDDWPKYNRRFYLIGHWIDDATMAHLRGLKQLQIVSLQYGGITDAGLVHLEELTCLQALDLGSNKITDSGLTRLKRLVELKDLSLACTQITDAGLVHLKELTQLQTLHLSYTQVTDAGLVHLKKLTQLKALTLIDTQVSDAGAANLRQALPNCQIRHFNIRVASN